MKEKLILKDALCFMLLSGVHKEWLNWLLKVMRYEIIDIQRIEKLIERGVDIDASDEAKNTMLHMAAERGYGLLVEVLKRNGANMDAKNMWGVTPRQLEAERKNSSPNGYFTSSQPHYYPMK